MSIIEIWDQIERTGILPPGFQARTITWDEKGWSAYIAGPGEINGQFDAQAWASKGSGKMGRY